MPQQAVHETLADLVVRLRVRGHDFGFIAESRLTRRGTLPKAIASVLYRAHESRCGRPGGKIGGPSMLQVARSFRVRFSHQNKRRGLTLFDYLTAGISSTGASAWRATTWLTLPRKTSCMNPRS